MKKEMLSISFSRKLRKEIKTFSHHGIIITDYIKKIQPFFDFFKIF